MKSFIILAAVFCFTNAHPGIVSLGHGPYLAAAPAVIPAAPILHKSYDVPTPIIHGPPVVSKVFGPPPAPVLTVNPIVTGPLVTRGIGPHILGAHPVLKAAPLIHAPLIKAAPIYSAPLYTKPLIAAAPLYHHGW